MDEQRVKEIIFKIDKLDQALDQSVSRKIKLEESKRMVGHLYKRIDECRECERYFIALEKKIGEYYDEVMDHNNTENILREDSINTHRDFVGDISRHLQKNHKMVPEGHYLTTYMSIGMSLGIMFGLTIFDNIALGLPIGMGVGIAIGSGLDEDAKKKGKVI